MAMYRSDDWKDGSEDELSFEEQQKIRIAILVSCGFIALLVATVYLVSITFEAVKRGVFEGLPAILYYYISP